MNEYEYANISFPEDLGIVVRTERKEQGLSQTELAQRAGCSQRFVSELERGKQGAEVGKAFQVLRALGLSFAISASRTTERSKAMVYDGINRVVAELEPRPAKKLKDYLGESS